MDIKKNLKIELGTEDTIADGILVAIALKGPKCYDDLCRSRPKGTGIRSSDVVKVREELGSQSATNLALKNLRNCKLLKVYKIVHKPRKKVLLDLTLPGLCVALSFKALWSRIDNVAENHGEKLPLILGKWKFFREIKVVNIVKRRMKECLSIPPVIIHVSPFHLLISGLRENRKEKKESFMQRLVNDNFEHRLQEDLNRSILFPWVFGIVYDFYVPNVKMPVDKKVTPRMRVTDDIEKWISILLLDDELKSYLFNELDHLEKYGDFCSRVAKLYKHVIDKYPLYWYSKKS
jgi:hypothetical protein